MIVAYYDSGRHTRAESPPRVTRGLTKAYRRASQTWVHRLALQGEDAEHALVDPAQRLPAGEPLQALDAEGELAQGEGALVAQAPVPKSGQVPVGGVVRAVDEPQVLPPPTLHSGLDQPTLTPEDEVE